MPTYVVTWPEGLFFAMLALAVDLVSGFAGVLRSDMPHLRLGRLRHRHAYLMRQIGTRGVYGNPNLPDFMVFLGWKQLPWYWLRLRLVRLLDPDGDPRAGGARRCLRLARIPLPRHWSLPVDHHPGPDLRAAARFFRNDMGFGGNNGLTDFKDILGFNVQRPPPVRPCW